MKTSEIQVRTLQNVVQLSGSLDSGSDPIYAVDVARNAKGVQSVRNNLIACQPQWNIIL